MHKTTAGVIIGLIIVLLFTACGELDTLFSPSRNYQVRAMVNGSSLEDCSIIRAGDKIYPYFAVSVENDPDLSGLLVYLLDTHGEIAGDRVLYVLDVFSVDTHTETEEESQNTNTESSLRENRGFISAKPADTIDAITITVKSLEQELPFFSLPDNLEFGSYMLVFQAIGKNVNLYRTELEIFYLSSVEFSINYISMYLPGVYETRLISPGSIVMLESRLDFDSRLDPYVIWYNGKDIIKEGKINNGASRIFWQAPDNAGFYSLRLEVFPFQLRSGYTGISREITLPVSSASATANTGFFFCDGPEHTAQNSLSAGTIFPEQLTAASADDTELLPVLPELLHWYQFEGLLHDSVSRYDTDRDILSIEEKNPQWAVAGQSYGLSTGPENAWRIPPVNFLENKEEQGGGIFLFHISSLSDGSVYNAFFPYLNSANDGATIEILRLENSIALRLHTTGTVIELPVTLPLFDTRLFIPAIVEFYIRPYRLEAKITICETFFQQSATGSVRLQGALSGECRITLGGAHIKSISNHQDADIPSLADPDTQTASSALSNDVNTIWNEFAVLYSSLAILPEENFFELPIADTLTAMDTMQDSPEEEETADEPFDDDSDDVLQNAVEEQEPDTADEHQDEPVLLESEDTETGETQEVQDLYSVHF